MTIFLTGGSGFLGQAIVRALEARETPVRALVRPDGDTSCFRGDRIDIVLGDVRDPASVRAGMAGCRAVVNVATLTQGHGRTRDFEATNLAGFRNVMQAAHDHKASIVVHVSCFLALGPTFGAVVDEDHRADRKNPGPFEQTIRAADRLTRSYISGGLPLCVVYPGLLYGPGPIRGGNVISSLVVEHAKGRRTSIPADEETRVSLAHVDDVAEAICRAVDRAKPGERFLLGGENVSFFQFFRKLGGVTGLKPPKPARSAVGAGTRVRFAEWGRRIRGMAPPTSRLLLDLMQNDWAYDSGKAAHRLDYTPRPLSKGLKETVKHLVLEGKLT